MATKPTTQKLMIEQLWDDVRGENGGGIKELAQDNHVDIGEIKVDVAEIKGMVMGHVETARPTTKTITVRRLLEVAVTALILFVVIAGVVMFILGRLTADDIIRMMGAWKGGTQ